MINSVSRSSVNESMTTPPTAATAPSAPTNLPDRTIRPDPTTHQRSAMLPGWYMRADMPSRERFWNGSMWTDLERDAPILSEFLGPVEPIIRALLDSYDQSATDQEAMSRFAMRSATR